MDTPFLPAQHRGILIFIDAIHNRNPGSADPAGVFCFKVSMIFLLYGEILCCNGLVFCSQYPDCAIAPETNSRRRSSASKGGNTNFRAITPRLGSNHVSRCDRQTADISSAVHPDTIGVRNEGRASRPDQQTVRPPANGKAFVEYRGIGRNQSRWRFLLTNEPTFVTLETHNTFMVSVLSND
jgi:hypothetical protein